MRNDDSQILGLSDEELFERVKEGSETAFSEVYKKYWDRLYFFAAKKIGQFEDGENLVQEVFMDLWKRRKEIELKHTLSVYLFAAIKYRIINYLARKDRQDEFQNYLSKKEQHDTSTENWLSFEELRHILEGQVESLPEKCKMVYQMREHGYTHKEIAMHLKISEKTVENHITRALKIIKAGISQLISLFFL